MNGSLTLDDSLRASSVAQLVERQSAIRPDAVAVASAQRALSYSQLDTRASELAHRLDGAGIRPGDVVACCLERSVDMVVALLGILKAGAAYLPLDPGYPAERLAHVVDDARSSLVITRTDLQARLGGSNRGAVWLDIDDVKPHEVPSAAVDWTARADDLAYVIYTSGSTGQPKGVEITNRSLLNLVSWHLDAFAIQAADRATQVTSPAFDATGWELWPYLAAGASVHLPGDDTRTSARLLRDWLLDERITVTFLPTPLAESIMTLEWPPTTSLRLLLTGADTLHRYPSPTLPFAVVNNYGPTETTVVATSGVVPATTEDHSTLPSIGRPIANTVVHVLDESLRPVGVGESGELYIGGEGVGRGYRHRPELTAERFLRDPFAENPDARLYRTGDLGHYLPDGQLAFLGRLDQQIKIRGFRIEPDEIVRALNRHPDVQASIVVDRDDGGTKQLVAYITPVAGSQPAASSLREVVAATLPDYMVPSVFVRLESQPLTANGKVDRGALPEPSDANILRDPVLAAPETETEERLIEIVKSLLKAEWIGIDDNFFLIGGSSLMGTQLIVQTAATFGIELPLRTLFEKPTVRQLAAEVERMLVARIEAMSEEDVVRLLQ